MIPLAKRLELAGLRPKWEGIINRVSAKRKRFPCGARLRFGPGNWAIDVAFRTFEDHFTVFKDDRVVASFSLDFAGTLEIKQPLTA